MPVYVGNCVPSHHEALLQHTHMTTKYYSGNDCCCNWFPHKSIKALSMPGASLIALPCIHSLLPFLLCLSSCPSFLSSVILHFLRHLMPSGSAHKLVLEGADFQECWWLNSTKYAFEVFLNIYKILITYDICIYTHIICIHTYIHTCNTCISSLSIYIYIS